MGYPKEVWFVRRDYDGTVANAFEEHLRARGDLYDDTVVCPKGRLPFSSFRACQGQTGIVLFYEYKKNGSRILIHTGNIPESLQETDTP